MASTSSQEEKPSGQWWQNPCDRLFNCGKASDSNSQSVNEGEAKEKPRKPVAFWDLFKYGTKGDKICAIIGMAAGFVAGMGLAIPYFTSGMIASALIVHGKNAYDPKLYSHAMPWVAADLALAIITFACAYIQTYCLKRSCANITAKLRIKFIESILQQDASYLDTQKFGSINQQLSENIDKITDGIGEQIGLIIRGVAAVVACIVFGLAVGWQGTLINLIVCPVNLIFMVLMIKLISISTRKQEPYAEKAASVMQESIINVKTVQCCNGQTQMVDRFRSLLATGRGYAVLNYFWNGFFEACVFMALYVFFVVTFYYNAVAYYFGDIKDPGTVYIVPNAMFGAAYYLAINSPSVVSITKARVAAALIYEKIEREAPASKSVDLEDVEVTDGRIVFSNVIFSYSNGRRVLDGLSFTAEPGETVALVGHSGCGKSTTVSLLLRLYEPENGSITIDGMDIRLVNPASIRRAVGLVRQEPVLFGGTIADNIRLGDDEITDEQIEEACKITNAHDFIMRLSDGYDTPVGPGCVQLSGGQKQRIAIARAIVDNPKILLLDEATSALDVHSEMHVQKALKAASKGRTTLVIAHRLSTLRDASKIVVFDAGKVVESGTHYELQEFGGVYSSLVKAQEFKDSTISDDSITGVPEDSEYVPFSMPSEEVIVSPSRESFQVRPSSRTNSISCSTMELRPIPPTPATAAPQKCQRVNGLWLLSKNLKGQRAKLAIGIFVAMLRGLELPLYAFFIYFVMDALGDKGNWIDYRNTMLAYSFINLGIGVFSFFTILIPVALNGYIAENVVDAIKLRFLASILKRDGAFFDKPETSNAKLVSMMNSDVPQIKSKICLVGHRQIYE
uniref:ABC transporter, ATP-binding protein n=1 Tax=Panagrellus redivivus TaxID=6233 RepID=A0A7E4WCK5_PANRE